MAHYLRAMRPLLCAVLLLVLLTPAYAAAITEQHSSPAKGTRTCYIRQYDSEHLKALRAAETAKFGMTTVPSDSEIYARVSKGGGVALGISQDTYPGTRAYFLVDGHRYSGTGWVSVPADALVKEKLVQFTYTSWP